MMSPMVTDSAAPISQETSEEPNSNSLQEGYCIEITVTTDGYRVSGPEPLPEESGEEQSEPETGESFPTLANALKHVVLLVKENPVGADENAMMEAGHAAGRGM